MWRDPIVEEVRRNRERYAATFNHQIKAICRAARSVNSPTSAAPKQTKTKQTGFFSFMVMLGSISPVEHQSRAHAAWEALPGKLRPQARGGHDPGAVGRAEPLHA